MSEQIRTMRAQRAQQREAIQATPHLFKVCSGCGSIFKVSASVCSLCKSYRFEDGLEPVLAQLREFAHKQAEDVVPFLPRL